MFGEDTVPTYPSASAVTPQLNGQRKCPMADRVRAADSVRNLIPVMRLCGAVRESE